MTHMKKFHEKLSVMTLLALTGALMTGCARYKVISGDREILRAKRGVALVPAHDGWFIPDATWVDINDALAKKVYNETNSNSGNPAK